MAEAKHRVVIVGGGFGGLYCATHLRSPAIELTLIDRRNFHLFQPLLYQVATGALSPANIAAPLRSLLRHQRNARVLLGEVCGIEAQARQVVLSGGERLPYDTLIVATGVTHQYFAHPEWEADAPGLKTIEDATEMRHRILRVFEEAEIRALQTGIARPPVFVLVGGGPTGVELAGAIGEIARYTLRDNFRGIDPAQARILLVEASPRILSSYPPEQSANAARVLRRMGVEVREASRVTGIQGNAVTLETGGSTETLVADSILWTAGVKASPLGAVLRDGAGAPLDSLGRVLVEPDLSIAGHPEIFVLGDLANTTRFSGEPLPGVAQVAMQSGKFVAAVVTRRAKAGHASELPETKARFQYRDLGSLATIGRAAAVGNVFGLRVQGLVGWVAWLLIHVLQLLQFENKLLVLTQWAWSYFTRGRSARLITGELEQR